MIPRAIRIYDKNAKEMVYPKQGTDRGVFVGMDGYPMQFDGKQFFKLDQCVAMYDTGMRTKGGIMIWEGDICEVDVPLDMGGIVSYIKGRGVMAWHPAGRWFLKMKKKSMMQEGDFQVVNSNVIGNVFEHKYLLKND